MRAQTFSMLAVRVPPTRVESKARELERQCVELQHQQEMQARRVLITVLRAAIIAQIIALRALIIFPRASKLALRVPIIALRVPIIILRALIIVLRASIIGLRAPARDAGAPLSRRRCAIQAHSATDWRSTHSGGPRFPT